MTRSFLKCHLIIQFSVKLQRLILFNREKKYIEQQQQQKLSPPKYQMKTGM